MTNADERHSELMELTQRWMADGMSAGDVVEVLIKVTNIVIDQNNLEYNYFRTEKK